jgi:hypothetical protein
MREVRRKRTVLILAQTQISYIRRRIKKEVECLSYLHGILLLFLLLS